MVLSVVNRGRKPSVTSTTISATTLPTGRDQVVATSFLPGVDLNDLWMHVGTPQGINDELAPYIFMRMPKGATWTRLPEVPIGEQAGRCDLFLFKVIKVDHDDLVLAEVRDGSYFREQSSTRTLSLWGHERTLTPGEGGVWVEDRVTFEVRPALRALRPIHRRIATWLFRHRHDRLNRHVGPRLATNSSATAWPSGGER